MRKLLVAAIALVVIIIIVGGGWLVVRAFTSPKPEATPAALPTPVSPLAANPAVTRTAIVPAALLVPGNLLDNPSFEGQFVNCGMSCNVAPGWTAWSIDPAPCIAGTPGCYIPCPQNCVETHPDEECATDFGCWWCRAEHKAATIQFPERVHSGESAQQAFAFGRMAEYGVYQIVQVPVGKPVRLTVWTQAWQCFDPQSTLCKQAKSDDPDEMNLRIGIGALGETDPLSSTVVWSEPIESFDHYSPITLTATTQNVTITVFMYARPEWEYSRRNNDAYWDDANLVIVEPEITAQFLSITPAQPELGQATTIKVSSPVSQPNTVLTITNPVGTPATLAGEVVSGSGPFTWTWTFTPLFSGTHSLAFASSVMAKPITTSLRAIAAINFSVQPAAAWLSQTVVVQTSAYHHYIPSQLTFATPSGEALPMIYYAMTYDQGLYKRAWHYVSMVTGTHHITFTSSKLPAPVTASVEVVSTAGVYAIPPAPPLGAPTTISAWAYYPYTNPALLLLDPGGTPLTSNYLGQSGGWPFVWSWSFTPTITGTHQYMFTASALDAPVQGRIFVGGHMVYLPIMHK